MSLKVLDDKGNEINLHEVGDIYYKSIAAANVSIAANSTKEAIVVVPVGENESRIIVNFRVHGTGARYCDVYSYETNGDEVMVYLRNSSSSTITVNVNVVSLFLVRNS